MTISKENIGDIIVMESGHRFRVENVDEKYVTYRNENGESYATEGHRVNGHVEHDPQKIKDFNRHCEVGKVLRAAQTSAYNKVFSALSSPEELGEAASVLKGIKDHQSSLETRIQEGNTDRQSRSTGIDSLIRGANQRQSRTQKQEPSKNQEKAFDRE